MNDLSNLLDSAPSLQVKSILTAIDQEIHLLVGVRFSFSKWLKNIGRDELGYWQFGFNLGFYEIYAPFLIPAGTPFYLFELAIVNLERYAFLSNAPALSTPLKIRIPFGSDFKYIEVNND